jgi:hypothetical protein
LTTATADNFDVNYPTITSITETDSLADSLSSDGVTVLMGVVRGDANTISAFLMVNPSACIFLGPQDFYVFYSDFVIAFSDSEPFAQARLLFLINLPLWTDTLSTAHASSTARRSYHAAASTPYSPLLLQMFVMIWFLESVTANVVSANVTSLLDFIYDASMIAARDVVLGQSAWNCTRFSSSSSCVRRNYDARNFVRMSMSRVLDPSIAADAGQHHTRHDLQPSPGQPRPVEGAAGRHQCW